MEAGRLALGLAPIVLFFALTSERWDAALAIATAWSGLTGLRVARRRLARAEPVPGERTRMGLLALGWTLLTALVGLRIAYLMTGFLLDHSG